MRFFEYELNSFDSEKDNKYEFVKNVFEIFCKKVIFDSTQNLLKNTLFFDHEKSIENIENGFGLNCQEQFFLLNKVLNELRVSSKIVHGDIYDFDLCIIKPLLTSALYIEDEDGFIHVNPIAQIVEFIPYESELRREKYTIKDVSDEYYLIEKKDDEFIYSTEKIYKHASENARIKKLKNKFKDSSIVPFGITNPFYWVSNPERRVFYNILMDTIRIQTGRESKDFDLLEWKTCPESSWLTDAQKERVSVCVNSINDTIDDYLEVSDVAFITIEDNEKYIYDKYTFIDENGDWKEEQYD